MNRLACVGKSSKVLLKDAVAVNSGTLGLGGPAENIPVHSKTQNKQCTVLHNLSPSDVTVHEPDGSPKQTPPVDAGTEATLPHTEEDRSANTDCVERTHEPVLKTPQHLEVPEGPSGESLPEADNSNLEKCGENEDSNKFCAPIELLAEFLMAVMEKNYTLAKKLCQMILIYEPENPEARHFLPLIEERLLLEEAREMSSCANNSSDNTNKEDISENDDYDDDSTEDDEDDDDNDDENTDSTNSDDECTDSFSSSSSSSD